MKLLFSFLFLTLSVSLFARENPFASTDTFEQKKREYLKQIEDEKKAQQEAQAAIEKEKELAKLAEQLAKEKAEQQRLAMLAKEEEEKRKAAEQKMMEEKLAKQKAMEAAKEAKILRYNPLEFAKFKIYESSLVIDIDESFKLINEDIIYSSNKFLFDFKGKADFYTKRKNLTHPLFKSIAVGNHPKKGLFRVVIAVNDDIKTYQEIIEMKKGMITIKKLK